MTRAAFIVCLIVLSIPANAEEYVECTYRLPSTGERSFFEEKFDEARWLKAENDDHSIPNWDDHHECHSVNQKKVWSLRVQTAGGTVSRVPHMSISEFKTLEKKLKGWPSGRCDGESCVWETECYRD